MLSEILDELEDGSNGVVAHFSASRCKSFILNLKIVHLKVKKLSSQITQLNSISETAQKLLTIPKCRAAEPASVLGIELG